MKFAQVSFNVSYVLFYIKYFIAREKIITLKNLVMISKKTNNYELNMSLKNGLFAALSKILLYEQSAVKMYNL